MLSEQDKRRIEAEEAYRLEVRNRLGPVKTESFTDKLNRFRLWWSIVWFAILIGLAIKLFAR